MRRRRRSGSSRTALFVAALLSIAALVSAESALGAASAGISYDCDGHGHCISGSAFSSNGGVNLDTSGSDVGAIVAACKGVANGAVLVEVTCSIGRETRTISFPGTAGVVPMVSDTGTLARVPVCWDAKAYFPNLAGLPFQVPTDGCAIVAV